MFFSILLWYLFIGINRLAYAFMGFSKQQFVTFEMFIETKTKYNGYVFKESWPIFKSSPMRFTMI